MNLFINMKLILIFSQKHEIFKYKILALKIVVLSKILINMHLLTNPSPIYYYYIYIF